MFYLFSYFGLSTAESNKTINESISLGTNEGFEITFCKFMKINSEEAPLLLKPAQSQSQFEHKGIVNSCVFEQCSGAQANTFYLLVQNLHNMINLSKLCIQACNGNGCGLWNINSKVGLEFISCYDIESTNHSMLMGNTYTISNCNFTALKPESSINYNKDSQPTVEYSYFSKCTSKGSVIYFQGVQITMKNCNLLNNKVEGEFPLIHIQSGAIGIENLALIGNQVNSNLLVQVSDKKHNQEGNVILRRFDQESKPVFQSNNVIQFTGLLSPIAIDSCLPESGSGSNKNADPAGTPAMSSTPKSTFDPFIKKAIIIVSVTVAIILIIIIIVIFSVIAIRNKKKEEPVEVQEEDFYSESSGSKEETLKAENPISNQQDINGSPNNDPNNSVNLVVF